MKKIILALLIGITLTGCGNKIKCTKNMKNEVLQQKMTYNIYKKKDNITKVITKEKYEIYNEEINENYDYLLSFRFDNLNDKNIKYDYTHKNNKYNLTTTYDLNTMDEETINEYIGTKNISEYIDILTEQGYKCK